MAFITRDQAINQLRAEVALARWLREYTEMLSGTHLLGWLDIRERLGRGDYSGGRTVAAAQTRAFLASALNERRSALGGCMLEWAHIDEIGRAVGSNVGLAFSEIWDWMVANGERVESREFTFGVPTVVASTGNGIIYRCNVDPDGVTFEAQTADTKRAICVRDQNTGRQRYQEQFEFLGREGPRDYCETRGVGDRGLIDLPTYEEKSVLLNNPHFSAYSAAGVPTAWTRVGAPVIDAVNTVCDREDEPTPASLAMVPGDAVYQAVPFRGAFRTDVPYFFAVRFNRSVGTATGTLRLTLGAVTYDVNLTTAGAGWQDAVLGYVASPIITSTDIWYANFLADEMTARIDFVAAGGGGTVRIDDVTLVPWPFWDGCFLFPRTGTTPWMVDDELTWDDTEELDTGHINRELWRFRRRTLPAATGTAVTIADPALTSHTTLMNQVGLTIPPNAAPDRPQDNTPPQT